MRPITLSITALFVFMFMLTSCSATRCKPDEMTDALNRQAGTVASEQRVTKLDLLTGVAIADSDGDALNANTKTGVDVTSPNQATAAPVQFSLLPDVSKILARTTPGEQATLDRLAATEQILQACETRLATDPTLTPEECAYFDEKIAAAKVDLAALLNRLDAYSKEKMTQAIALAPDLSALTQVLFLVQQVTTAGSEKGQISDAQADSIARVAETAVQVTPVPERGGE